MAYHRVPTVYGSPTDAEDQEDGSPRSFARASPSSTISSSVKVEAGGVQAAPDGSGCASCCGILGQHAVVLAIVFWNFGTSILLVNSVKYIYVTFDFRYPLFIAATHMGLSWVMCALVLQRWHASSPSKPALLPFSDRVRRILPFSLCGAASIGCGNLALTFLYPSFHEMLQATTPFFALLTSVALRDRRFNAWAYLSMVPLCGGAALSTAGEANFSWAGVAFSLAAVEFRSLRAVLQGWLLCDEQVDSVTLCYYMAPFNVLIFGVWGAALEGSAPLHRLIAGQPGLGPALLLSAGLACSFNIASFLTIRYLNAVGAVVVQNAKTPATILLSLAIFKNSLTGQQVFGFAVTFFGVWLYGRTGRSEQISARAHAHLDIGSKTGGSGHEG